MAIENQLDSVCAELDKHHQKFLRAFENKDFQACNSALNQHFTVLHQAESHDVFPALKLLHYVEQWGESVVQLASISLDAAFSCAEDAWQTYMVESENLPCDEALANTVAICINGLVEPALKQPAARLKFMPLENSERYIVALSDILQAIDPSPHAPHLEKTFYDTLSRFENLLLSHYVSPAKRYEHVKSLKDYADTKGAKGETLSLAMDVLLYGDVVMLPNGQGIIQNYAEKQADKCERTNLKQPGKKVVGIEAALAFRGKVPTDYAMLYQNIERAFTSKNFERAETELCRLFHQLSDSVGNTQGQTVAQSLAAREYLKRAADRLAAHSPANAFNLASRCILAIEEQFSFSEQLHETVFQFSVPVIVGKEEPPAGNYTTSSSLNLAIMKRTSHFGDEKKAQEIFDRAAIRYRQHLESLSVEERFDKLWEISEWLNEGGYKEGLLESFVEEMLNKDMQQGRIQPISRMYDDRDNIYQFPARQL